MKKILNLGLLVLCAATLGSLTNPVVNRKDSDLQTSTIDFVNEKQGIKKANIKSVAKNGKFNASKIYAQTATDENGYEYLRFATALRGNFTNVTYTRHIEGLEDKTEELTTLYKGISANGVTTYSNGSDFVNYDVTSTKNYYWACYTIKFNKDSIYKRSDITITLKVDDYVDTRTTSLENTKNYIEDTTVDDIESDEKINYAKIYGYDYSYDLVSERYNVSGYTYIHGACNDLDDERYAYFSMNATGNTIGVIGKYDFEANKIVAYSKKYTVSNAITWSDNANIFAYKDKIYVIDSNGKFVSVKTSELTSENSAEVTQDDSSLIFKYNGAEIEKIKSVAYSKVEDKFAVYASNTIYFFDGNLNYLSSINNAKTSGLQTLYSYKNKLYGLKNISLENKITSEDGTTKVECYDTANVLNFNWNGDYISTKEFGSRSKPLGEVYVAEKRCSNMQNMIIVNDEMYLSKLMFTSSTAGDAGGYLFKVTTGELKKHSNMTVGEYVEKNNMLDSTNIFKANEIMAQCKTANGWGYLQGITTDGENIYYAFTNGSNTITRIVRSNPISGEWTEAIKGVTLAEENKDSLDAGKIFFYNDNVWVTKFDGKTVVEVNKDTLEVTRNEITFSNMPENIKNVAYDKFNDRLIILGVSGALYSCENEETITKLADAKGFSGQKVSNLFANDDYIYVTYTTNGVKGVKTSIFDFDGNLIKQVNVEDKTNICPNTNNFNTQGLIDYKGVGIVIGLSWDSTYGGGYAYSINMK